MSDPMYAHTIAIARCLLTEGRLSDVDRMISPLVAGDGKHASSPETLMLKGLLAQARLLNGSPPEEVLALLPSGKDLGDTASASRLESAIAALSVGLALALPDPQTQDIPRALHLLQISSDALADLRRSDYLHWAYLGQAIAYYSLNELKEAESKLEQASSLIGAINDRAAQRWLDGLTDVFLQRRPLTLRFLSSTEERSPLKREAADRVNGIPEVPVASSLYISDRMHSLIYKCKQAADGFAPILLSGERGSGKETTARLIHELQPHEKGSFEVVDCADIATQWEAPQYLAATFPMKQQPKTIFLNQIDHLSGDQQQSLLGYLKKADGLGGFDKLPARIISGTSVPLAQYVRQGKFDANLFHLLKIRELEIPPLRTRKEDIPILAFHFASALRPAGVPRVAITEQAMAAFVQYDWPGNIRQLRNEIERVLVHAGPEPLPTIDLRTLSKDILSKRKSLPDLSGDRTVPEYPLDEIMTDTEKTVIEKVLVTHQGQVSSAAGALGLTRQGLYKKLKRLGIQLDSFSRPKAKTDE